MKAGGFKKIDIEAENKDLPASSGNGDPTLSEVGKLVVEVTPDLVRSKALALLPTGADQALEALKAIGVSVPQATVLEGQSVEEAIATDLQTLNLLIGRMIGVMRHQSQVSGAMEQLNTVLSNRFAAQLTHQRKAGDQEMFQKALAATVGGSFDSGFQFRLPTAYELPQGWQEFGNPEALRQLAGTDAETIDISAP